MKTVLDIMLGACANPKLIGGVPEHDLKEKRNLAVSIREKIRQSRVFYIDDEVTQAATNLGVHHPRILLEMLHRARTPFPKIWLEWSVAAQVKAANGTLADDAPERTGCFVEQMSEEESIFRITIIHIGPAGMNGFSIVPLCIYYNLRSGITTLPSLFRQREILEAIAPDGGGANVQAYVDYIRKALLGGAYQEEHPKEDEDEEEKQNRIQACDALSEHAMWIRNPMLNGIYKKIETGQLDHRYKKAFRDLTKMTIQECSGTWRQVVSLLALLNAHDFVQHEQKIPTQKSHLVNGRSVPYLQHVLVSLKLPRKVVENQLVRSFAESSPRRRHDVSGSWRQWRHRGDPKCEHAYIDVTPNRQRCQICGHARWWVPSYQRGDATVGYVIKDYLVERH